VFSTDPSSKTDTFQLSPSGRTEIIISVGQSRVSSISPDRGFDGHMPEFRLRPFESRLGMLQKGGSTLHVKLDDGLRFPDGHCNFPGSL
jgi:hypothetical protein